MPAQNGWLVASSRPWLKSKPIAVEQRAAELFLQIDRIVAVECVEVRFARTGGDRGDQRDELLAQTVERAATSMFLRRVRIHRASASYGSLS